ncbi:hypothetical protein EDEG_01208 [Edhazardia aedis USNM 41457]|uniref:Uncharacterized protein n=1 Tax=Edhazardia aedis (strain USNM 41457) TaxID=1003232 RepID=J9DAT9_EDHAE|nr:hypothetical protein EDEG_01208 [Edhazardia aedis USNM 41457]|eukprot:EJW04594.1 hypothetical protein EDEG_01208 [Edhazardia aedis USNM 41457]
MNISKKTIGFLVSILLLIFTSSSIFFLIQHVENNKRNYSNAQNYTMEINTENNHKPNIKISTESYIHFQTEKITEKSGNTLAEVNIEKNAKIKKNILEPLEKNILELKGDFSAVFPDTEIVKQIDISKGSQIATKCKNVFLDQFIIDSIKPNFAVNENNFFYTAKATSNLFLYNEKEVRYNIVFIEWRKIEKTENKSHFYNVEKEFNLKVYEFFIKTLSSYKDSEKNTLNQSSTDVNTDNVMESLLLANHLDFLLKYSVIKAFFSYFSLNCMSNSDVKTDQYNNDPLKKLESYEQQETTIIDYLQTMNENQIKVDSNNSLFFVSYLIPFSEESSKISTSCILRSS